MGKRGVTGKDLFWERESLLLWGDVLGWCFREGGLPTASVLLENNPVSYHCGCFTFPIPLVGFEKVVALYPKQFVRQSSSATSRWASLASPGSFLASFLRSFCSMLPNSLVCAALEDGTRSPSRALLKGRGEVSSLLSCLPGHTFGDWKSGILVTELCGPHSGFFYF